MYKNIAQETKDFVSLVTTIGIGILVIAIILGFFFAETAGGAFINLFVCLIAIIMIWASGLGLYALGQLVENSQTIIRNQERILQSVTKQDDHFVGEKIENLPEI